MKNKRTGCLSFLLLAISLFPASLRAQTREELTPAQKAFEGTWYCKKEQRYLKLFFDDYAETGYVTANEWTGKRKREQNIDAYKLFIEGDKLVFPEDKEEHRHPYCEAIKRDNRLLFQCKEFLVDTAGFTDQTYFIKLKE